MKIINFNDDIALSSKTKKIKKFFHKIKVLQFNTISWGMFIEIGYFSSFFFRFFLVKTHKRCHFHSSKYNTCKNTGREFRSVRSFNVGGVTNVINQRTLLKDFNHCFLPFSFLRDCKVSNDDCCVLFMKINCNFFQSPFT